MKRREFSIAASCWTVAAFSGPIAFKARSIFATAAYRLVENSEIFLLSGDSLHKANKRQLSAST